MSLSKVEKPFCWDAMSHLWIQEIPTLGCNVTPLDTRNTHTVADPSRTKKLLLNKRELAKLFAATQQKGHTCVCTKMYWKGHLIKCQIALAKGKQSHDKRASTKEREWNIDKQRIVRHANK